MTPAGLSADVRIPLRVHVAEAKLASAELEREAPFEAVAGRFPFTTTEGLAELRAAIRMTLASAGATTEPEAAAARYILMPIVLGGMAIPFAEAYAILFVRYELTSANGAQVWSSNVYSQAKVEAPDAPDQRSAAMQAAYGRLAAANLRQMASQLSAMAAATR